MSAVSTFSRTVICGMRLNDWKRNPIIRFLSRLCARSSRTPGSLPSSRIFPLVGKSRQPMRLNSVDFPEPDRPITATKLPRSIRTLIESRATTSFPVRRWTRRASMVSTMGVADAPKPVSGLVGAGPARSRHHVENPGAALAAERPSLVRGISQEHELARFNPRPDDDMVLVARSREHLARLGRSSVHDVTVVLSPALEDRLERDVDRARETLHQKLHPRRHARPEPLVRLVHQNGHGEVLSSPQGLVLLGQSPDIVHLAPELELGIGIYRNHHLLVLLDFVDVGLPHLGLDHHLREIGQHDERLVRPDLIAHLHLAFLAPEEDVLVDDQARDGGANLAFFQVLALGLDARHELRVLAPGKLERRLRPRQPVGAGALRLAAALLAVGDRGARGLDLRGPGVLHVRAVLDPEKLEVFFRLVDRLLRPIELELGNEPFGEERLQVLEARLRLLELALGLGELGRGFRLRELALPFDDAPELELGETELVFRLRLLLPRRDRKELELPFGLYQLRFGLRELRLRALELLGERLAVELHQQVAHPHPRPLRGE